MAKLGKRTLAQTVRMTSCCTGAHPSILGRLPCSPSTPPHLLLVNLYQRHRNCKGDLTPLPERPLQLADAAEQVRKRAGYEASAIGKRRRAVRICEIAVVQPSKHGVGLA